MKARSGLSTLRVARTVLLVGSLCGACTKRLIVFESDPEADGAAASAATFEDDATNGDSWRKPANYAVAVGHRHSCAIQAGTLYCWGGNEFGQLGSDPEETSDAFTVAPFDGPAHWTALALGTAHTCALTSEGEVYCWGENGLGQLGHDDQDETHVPKRVELTRKAVAISSGANHVCALLSSGQVRCWGDNRNGQLGIDTAELSYSRRPRRFGEGPFSRISAGSEHTCALAADPEGEQRTAELICAGKNDKRQLGRLDGASDALDGGPRGAPAGDGDDAGIPGIPDDAPAMADGLAETIDEVSAGRDHTCALTRREVVACWGSPEDGRLGTSTGREPTAAPVDVAVKAQVLGLAVGSPGSCALTPQGTFCWGNNRDGQLGLGEDTDVAFRATMLDFDGTIVEMSIGPEHSCALTRNGGVYCTGRNDEGQLGDSKLPDQSELIAVSFAPL